MASIPDVTVTLEDSVKGFVKLMEDFQTVLGALTPNATLEERLYLLFLDKFNLQVASHASTMEDAARYAVRAADVWRKALEEREAKDNG